MDATTMRLARAEATAENFRAIIGLIDGAAAWLRSKNTDQWAKPWPDRGQRDARIEKGLRGGKTWIMWDGRIPVATVTIAKQANPAVWSPAAYDLAEPAVYIHRLVTARSHAGWGLGGQLIDWAGRTAAEQYGARSIRIDVWTDNLALHDYYHKRDFEFAGYCPDPGYPSGALFEKPVSAIEDRTRPLLWQPPDTAWLA
ncbi:MAG: GNAT family N-acetyltransferase [Streptosporangiaceae bacterium]|nr:GNAT family N-acetyltransferase [Streptosporangiaceae bacterium]